MGGAMGILAPLRTRLEQSFAPLACDCSLVGDGSLTVRLYDRASGRVDLVVSGLNPQKLRSEDQWAALIEELRYELQSNTLGRSTHKATQDDRANS